MKKILLINSLLFFCLYANTSSAQFNKQDFKSYISNFGAKIIKASSPKSSSKKKIKDLEKLVDESINLKWISRFVLGKHYRSFSTSQFQEFLELYRKYMINNYGTKFSSYNGSKFIVKDVKFQKIFYLVDTEFYAINSDVPISISFRLKKKGDEIYIIDFIAEGISLLESQRSELDSVISSKGVHGFLEDLNEKVRKKPVNK